MEVKNIQQPQGNFIYPTQIAEATQAMASLVKLLLESSKTLSLVRREFRGEGMIQTDEGKNEWVQVSKPIFCKSDPRTEEPLRQTVEIDGKEREVFIPNDEAIEEVISMLKFMGLNQITPITNISNDNCMEDLKEFECKLAAVLCLKQKKWGLDKEILPMTMIKIKTIVQDSRMMAVEGGTLRALQTSVQRVEQAFEGEKFTKSKQQGASPFQ